MAFKDKQNPITVTNMLYNVLCKAGAYGRAWRVKFIEGEVIGVPAQPLDEKGFRNLLNLDIALGDDSKPVLRLYLNSGAVTNAFRPPTHDNKYWSVINSTFVLVQPSDGGHPVVCINLVEFGPEPTTTPAPTPTATPTSQL